MRKNLILSIPGTQGGPLMHVIAAKAVAFKEALEPEFKEYMNQVITNANVLAQTMMERGLKLYLVEQKII